MLLESQIRNWLPVSDVCLNPERDTNDRKIRALLLGFGVVILGRVATVEGLWPHPLETPPSLAEEPMRYGCVRLGQLLGATGRCQMLRAGAPASLAEGCVLS